MENINSILITDQDTLQKYSMRNRLWQGIPSVEVTDRGRIYVTFYSGGHTEEIGNYVCLLKSDNGGEAFSDPIVVCYLENHRCFDPCLWIDPTGRLWLTWSICPDDGCYGVICDKPDADELTFSQPFFIGNNVMMNKPIVTNDSRWLFPIAVWKKGIRTLPAEYDSSVEPKGSFVYETLDEGKTFHRLGSPDVADRQFDEHMLLQLSDGRIRNFVRTTHGIGAADSFDGGLTFGKDFDTGYGGPGSRFHIRRLSSGRILLINHYHFSGRNNLYAMLSEDEGETFPYKLLIDERSDISYPDAKETPDRNIYLVYDRDRGAYRNTIEEALSCEREILLARITEDDILAGKINNETSFSKRIVSKLDSYAPDLFC